MQILLYNQAESACMDADVNAVVAGIEASAPSLSWGDEQNVTHANAKVEILGAGLLLLMYPVGQRRVFLEVSVMFKNDSYQGAIAVAKAWVED